METKRGNASPRVSNNYNLRSKGPPPMLASSSTSVVLRQPPLRYRRIADRARQMITAEKYLLKQPSYSNRVKETVQDSSNKDTQKICKDSVPAEEEDVKCCICFDTENFSTIQTLQCGHTFHKVCVGIWFQQKRNYCPMCRAHVDPISVYYLSKFRHFANSITQWTMRSLFA